MKRKLQIIETPRKKVKNTTLLPLRIHGNYVGPGWSAGKYQDSVVDPGVPAVDEFDQTALEHDAAYAQDLDLKKADYKFAKQNIGKGFVRTISGLAVGLQGLLRSGEQLNTFLMPTVAKKRKVYRKSGGVKKAKKTVRKNRRYAKKAIKKAYRKKAGKRKYGNKVSFKYANIKGYQANIEVNTTDSSANCQYVAYGTPASLIFQSAIRSIWKSTLLKAGLSLKAWTDKVDTANQVALRWTIQAFRFVGDVSGGDTPVEAIVVIDPADSHLLICSKMEKTVNDWYKTGTSSLDLARPHLLQSRLESYQDASASTATVIMSKVQLDQQTFNFRCRSKIKMQNRTLSAGTGDNTEGTDVVDRVPLTMKVYRSAKWRDGCVPFIPENPGSRQSFKLNHLGLITRDASSFQTDSVNNPYRKPVPGFFLGAKKTARYTVQPGQIVADEMYFQCSMKLNTFMQKFGTEGQSRTATFVEELGYEFLNNGVGVNDVGKMTIFAFEKLVSPAAAEKDIEIVSQVDHQVSAYLKTVQARSMPLTVAEW